MFTVFKHTHTYKNYVRYGNNDDEAVEGEKTGKQWKKWKRFPFGEMLKKWNYSWYDHKYLHIILKVYYGKMTGLNEYGFQCAPCCFGKLNN